MLEVIEPGPLTTVQDGGRPASVSWGVPVGGACDQWAMAAANALAGNSATAAVLEMTLSGASLRARADCLVGVAGAEMGGRIVETGQPVASGTSVVVRTGQQVEFGAASGGARGYLALAGGVDVPLVLGSASTCLVAGFGGVDGRALRAGDLVAPAQPARLTGGTWHGPAVLPGATLRVVRGPHADRLAAGALDALLGGEWQVSARGDRQGIVLDGPPLPAPRADRAPMLSEGVVWGAIQLPPDGHPIALLADHNTIGGYPVVAVVIRADLPLLGQLGPGDALRFVELSLADARAALVERRQQLAAATAQRGAR